MARGSLKIRAWYRRGEASPAAIAGVPGCARRGGEAPRGRARHAAFPAGALCSTSSSNCWAKMGNASDFLRVTTLAATATGSAV